MTRRAVLRVAIALEGILACAGFLAIVSVSYAGDKEKSYDLMESYTEGIANGISSFFSDAAAVASAAATLHSARQLRWDVACMDFTGFIRSNRYIHRMSLVDSSGFIYDAYETGPAGNPWLGGKRTENNAAPDSPPIIVTDREYFRILVKENVRGDSFVVINEPFVPAGLTEKAFVTSVAVIRNGRPVGSVSVAQTALELSMLYENLTTDFLGKFGRNAHMYLVSQGGQLISSLEYRERYGAYMDELFGSAETVSVLTLDDDTVSAITEAVMQNRRVVSAKMAGKPHLVTGVKIEGTPFAVCLAVPRAYMLKIERTIIAASSIFVLLSVVVAFAGAMLMKKGKSQDKSEGGNGRHSRKKQRATGKWRGSLGNDLDAPVLPPR